MLGSDQVRLDLLKVLIPVASRHGLTSDELVKTCTQLENYVIGLQPSEETPTSPPRKTLIRPERTTDVKVPGFLTPPSGGQVETKPR